jgi:hypothetical protein
MSAPDWVYLRVLELLADAQDVQTQRTPDGTKALHETTVADLAQRIASDTMVKEGFAARVLDYILGGGSQYSRLLTRGIDDIDADPSVRRPSFIVEDAIEAALR